MAEEGRGLGEALGRREMVRGASINQAHQGPSLKPHGTVKTARRVQGVEWKKRLSLGWSMGMCLD
jgi:hypothetical protein